jgi:hypothetical protein
MPPKLPPRRAIPPVPPESEVYEYRPNTSNPPSIPKWTRPSPQELVRLLARPPPIPHKSVEEVPRRRVPPPPAPLPTPPPEPEPVVNDRSIETYAESHAEVSCLECWDFSVVDQHAACFPRHSVIDLDSLALDLTQPFSTETEKARAIFTWLHYNITYDAEAFFSGNVRAATADSTLQSGLAVCDGYAGLFLSLAERAGMHAVKVTGHGKGVGYQATRNDQPVPAYSSNHAWNCVYMDGEWHLIDSCWGAGALNGMEYHQRFDPTWFTCSALQFARAHFPEDPSYQLIPEKDGGAIPWYDYIMKPTGPTLFSTFYEMKLLPSSIYPSTEQIEGGQNIHFRVSNRCEHLSTAERDNYPYILSFTNERVPLELDAYGGWAVTVFIPRGIQEVTLMCVSTLEDKEGRGIEISALKWALGRKAMSFSGLAKWIVV